MRSNLALIKSRIALNLAESGTDITLSWETVSGGTFDPVRQTTAGGTVTTQTATVKGFVHFVQLAKQGVMQFAEFEQGDCIVDLAPDAEIDGKAHLKFTIDGQRWVAKDLGEKLAKTWDAVVQGQRLYRSVLLRKAT